MKRKLKNPEIRTKDELLNLKRHQYQAELDKTLSDLKKIEQIDKSKLDPELFDELAFHFRRLAAKAHDLSDSLRSMSPETRLNPIDPVLLKGIEVEMEHTNDPEEAMHIALDHLRESPNYYKDWAKKEKILFKEKVMGNPNNKKKKKKPKFKNKKGVTEIDLSKIHDKEGYDKAIEAMMEAIDELENKPPYKPSGDEVVRVFRLDEDGKPFDFYDMKLSQLKKLVQESGKVGEWDREYSTKGSVVIYTLPGHPFKMVWFYDEFEKMNPGADAIDSMLWVEEPYKVRNPVRRKKKTKVSKAGQKRVSAKIAKLMREKRFKSEDKKAQAIRIAYEMEKKHQLGPRGGRKK